MTFSKKAGPSAAAIWGQSLWRASRSVAMAVKNRWKFFVSASAAFALKAALVGLMVSVLYWTAPWLGSRFPLWLRVEPVATMATPTPSSQQWAHAKALIALMDRESAVLDCAVEKSNHPGVGGVIFIESSCSTLAWLTVDAAQKALPAQIQQDFAGKAFEPEQDAKVAEERRAALEQDRLEKERARDEQEEKRLDQHLALGIARRLRKGEPLESAAKSALSELKREQAEQAASAGSSGPRVPEGDQSLAERGGEAAKDSRVNDAAEKTLGKELQREEDADRDKYRTFALVKNALDGGDPVKVPLATLRQAMAPSALWTKDWATTRQGSAAQSSGVVSQMRLRGIVVYLAGGLLAFCLIFAWRAAASAMERFARATEERRLQALPAWEAKQVGQVAKAGAKTATKARL